MEVLLLARMPPRLAAVHILLRYPAPHTRAVCKSDSRPPAARDRTASGEGSAAAPAVAGADHAAECSPGGEAILAVVEGTVYVGALGEKCCCRIQGDVAGLHIVAAADVAADVATHVAVAAAAFGSAVDVIAAAVSVSGLLANMCLDAGADAMSGRAATGESAYTEKAAKADWPALMTEEPGLDGDVGSWAAVRDATLRRCTTNFGNEQKEAEGEG